VREPALFGRYLLLDRVDVGGMAEVFVARVREGVGAGRLVAVKRLLPHLCEDPSMVTLFLDEARIAMQLDHPSFAAVEDLGRQGASYYIAMEWVPGKDLGAVQSALRRAGRRMPVELAALVGVRVLEGLAHAHAARGDDGAPLGVVHRDVSPQNVLLSFAGEVKLLDFGIAEAVWRRAEPGGALRGKLAYLSPEQAAGGAADARSDVFAAAAVLHELLGGERLFQAPSEPLLLERVRAAEVEPPSRRNPEVPPELDRLVLRALARDPRDRLASAGSMAEALRPFAAGGGEQQLSRWLCDLFPEEARRERERLLPSGEG
jgi:serine/threonine-protein kinase